MNSQKPGRAVTFRFAPIRTIPGGFAGGARVPTLYVTKISFRVIVCLLEPEVRNPMNESKGRPLQPQILSYDEDYFHGRTSGYASEGYKNCHPDWSAWLDVLQSLVTSGIFLDCGCAYGYLVDEARRRGYQAFGIDISEFALRQEPGFRPWLAQADASRTRGSDAVNRDVRAGTAASPMSTRVLDASLRSLASSEPMRAATGSTASAAKPASAD